MKFDPQLFIPHVNEQFLVTRPDGQTVVLTLESVDQSIDDEIQLCFSLLFRSADPRLPAGNYTFTHAVLGEGSAYLTPVSGRRGPILHEAVFNLLRPAAQSPFPG